MKTRLAGPPNPYEVYFFIACALLGVSFLTGASRPSSIEQGLPPILRAVWATTISIGGVLALAGLFWPGHAITSLQVKRSGILLAGTGAFIYAGVVAVIFAHTGAGVYIPNFAFAVASVWRAVQVSWLLTPNAPWLRALISVAHGWHRMLGWLASLVRSGYCRLRRGRGERCKES